MIEEIGIESIIDGGWEICYYKRNIVMKSLLRVGLIIEYVCEEGWNCVIKKDEEEIFSFCIDGWSSVEDLEEGNDLMYLGYIMWYCPPDDFL